jgi:hypothetical protein
MQMQHVLIGVSLAWLLMAGSPCAATRRRAVAMRSRSCTLLTTGWVASSVLPPRSSYNDPSSRL